MLGNVLRSPSAVAMSVMIVRRSRNFVLYWRMMTNYRIHIGHRREVRFFPLP
jgi:hypothetical protein